MMTMALNKYVVNNYGWIMTGSNENLNLKTCQTSKKSSHKAHQEKF